MITHFGNIQAIAFYFTSPEAEKGIVGRNSKKNDRNFRPFDGTVSPISCTLIRFCEIMGSLHPRDVKWVNNSRHDQVLELITQNMLGHIGPKHGCVIMLSGAYSRQWS